MFTPSLAPFVLETGALSLAARLPQWICGLKRERAASSPGRSSARSCPWGCKQVSCTTRAFYQKKRTRKLPDPGSQCGCWGFSRDWCSGKPGTVRLGGCVMPWGPCATLPRGYDVPAAPHLRCPENMGQLNRVKVFGGVRLEPVGDERRAGGSTKALGAEFAASPNPLWAVVWDLCSHAAFSIAPDAVPAALWSRGVSTSSNPLHPQRGTVRSDP